MRPLPNFGILIWLASFTAISLQAEEPSLTLKSSFEKGRLYQKGKLKILVVEGSYYEMGRQYGALLKDSLPVALEVSSEIPAATNIVERYRHVLKQLRPLSWPGYSFRQKELLRGMSQESGISISDLILADQNLAVSFLLENCAGCSYLASWGEYTKDKKVILGRTFDWFYHYRDRVNDLAVIIFKPSDGSLSTAIIGYAGMISALTGINEKGIFLELNNGMNSFGPVVSNNRLPYLNQLTEFLWDCDDMPALERKLFTTRPQWPNIINIADSAGSSSFENAPFDTRQRKANEDGLLVSTNDMMLESWGILPLPSPTQSLRRYYNLLSLARKQKGKIDVKSVQEILDTPLNNEDGTPGPGATEIYKTPKNPTLTAYQVVAVPEDLHLYIKVPTKTDWIFLDLKPLITKAALEKN